MQGKVNYLVFNILEYRLIQAVNLEIAGCQLNRLPKGSRFLELKIFSYNFV